MLETIFIIFITLVLYFILKIVYKIVLVGIIIVILGKFKAKGEEIIKEKMYKGEGEENGKER